MQQQMDVATRQSLFLKGKDQLMFKAAEMSVVCGCEIAMVLFSPEGQLYTVFSSTHQPIQSVLERVRTEKPVESRSATEVWDAFESGNMHIEGITDPSRKRPYDEGPAGGVPSMQKRSSGPMHMPPPPIPQHHQQMQHQQQMQMQMGRPPPASDQVEVVGPSGQHVRLEGVRPAGFLDPRNYPLSPRSEEAYSAISAELDRL
eukprot:CAMPEP_0202870374 /NCGR_PEP_ID=MMETSP1391-20130828/15577_1 /ASSEMBLY_ACC=CAM_ASM_000867 /TAXON_ID=1034604 /ORGANISM="Chlamydomonas leiostraca, Strain SAG 11-49" /LENGTH=201 /DNA_ID=CAMNT_0049550931 /DNA_START=74 /DNA_END=676 /DNA_ORIENTATION=-